jgi:hypothetical protein
MEQMNFHKQKLYALIIAGVGVISCLLPWYKIDFGFISNSVNGMHGVGIIAFLGFLGAGIVTFIGGDKARPFEGQFKLIAAACFAGAGLFALIQFISETRFTSFGLWLAIIAGIAGAAVVYVLKPEQLDKKPPTLP